MDILAGKSGDPTAVLWRVSGLPLMESLAFDLTALLKDVWNEMKLVARLYWVSEENARLARGYVLLIRNWNNFSCIWSKCPCGYHWITLMTHGMLKRYARGNGRLWLQKCYTLKCTSHVLDDFGACCFVSTKALLLHRLESQRANMPGVPWPVPGLFQLATPYWHALSCGLRFAGEQALQRGEGCAHTGYRGESPSPHMSPLDNIL